MEDAVPSHSPAISRLQRVIMLPWAVWIIDDAHTGKVLARRRLSDQQGGFTILVQRRSAVDGGWAPNMSQSGCMQPAKKNQSWCRKRPRRRRT